MARDKTPIEYLEAQLKDISDGYLVAYVKDGKLHWKTKDIVTAYGIIEVIKEELKILNMLALDSSLNRHEEEIDEDGE